MPNAFEKQFAFIPKPSPKKCKKNRGGVKYRTIWTFQCLKREEATSRKLSMVATGSSGSETGNESVNTRVGDLQETN